MYLGITVIATEIAILLAAYAAGESTLVTAAFAIATSWTLITATYMTHDTSSAGWVDLAAKKPTWQETFKNTAGMYVVFAIGAILLTVINIGVIEIALMLIAMASNVVLTASVIFATTIGGSYVVKLMLKFRDKRMEAERERKQQEDALEADKQLREKDAQIKTALQHELCDYFGFDVEIYTLAFNHTDTAKYDFQPRITAKLDEFALDAASKKQASDLVESSFDNELHRAYLNAVQHYNKALKSAEAMGFKGGTARWQDRIQTLAAREIDVKDVVVKQ